MTTLTEAQKIAFADWILALLKANKKTIKEARPDILFPTEQYIKSLEESHDEVEEAEGKLTRLQQEKLKQTKIANDKMKKHYKRGSEGADAVVAHLGKDDKLSKLIRNKRDSMVLEAARGKKKPSEE